MQIEYVAFIVACPVQFHRMNICEMEGIIVELLGIFATDVAVRPAHVDERGGVPWPIEVSSLIA
jgi:hypothetical protein